MRPRFLLDTNAISEPLKPLPDPRFLRHFHSHRDHMAISAVTWHEALFGAARMADGKRRREVEAYLQAVILTALPILPYDSPAAEWHARERARLGAAGCTAPFADGQIAAIAAVQELTLVSRNKKDFALFEVAVADWWA